MSLVAAVVFTAAITAAVGFQLALAAGAPWGELAMGGRFPGRLPAAARVACLLQAALLGSMGAVVAVRAGLLAPQWADASGSLVWGVVVISGLSLVMNLATPSRRERQLWAPVALILLVSSTIVASGG